MSDQTTPKAATPATSAPKTFKFKEGIKGASIPGHGMIGGINETHLKHPAFQSLIRKARVNNAAWFDKHFTEA